MSLSQLAGFLDVITAFQKIERVYPVPGLVRKENDVEHSYQLALCAWYLATKDHLSLNKELLLRYGLVHDLVEVYAGDTYIYSTDTAHLESKAARETAAAKRLREEFPEFNDLHEDIERYEKRQDPESRFVYALDKLIPLLSIYSDDGRSWKKEGVTLEMLLTAKKAKVALSPEIEKYFYEMVDILKENESRVFPTH